MSVKAILVLCAQALLAQAVFSQCTSRAAVDASGIAGPFGLPSFGYNGLNTWLPDRLAGSRGLACEGIYPSAVPVTEFTPTSGGSLPVTSGSCVAPVGLSVMSENAYEGVLAAAGELPFVGTTAVEGLLPTAGAGAINHNCGNGINAMTALSGFSTPASVADIDIATPYGINGRPFAASAAYGAPACAAPGLLAPAIAAPGLLSPSLAAPGFAYDGYGCERAYGAPFDGIEFTATSGGSLPVTSASVVPPTGLVVAAETVYEGPLLVAGELPFVGTVAVEGVLPTAGAGAINHACGNGINAMVSETTAFAPGFAGAVAPGLGYPFGLRGCGCGY